MEFLVYLLGITIVVLLAVLIYLSLKHIKLRKKYAPVIVIDDAVEKSKKERLSCIRSG